MKTSFRSDLFSLVSLLASAVVTSGLSAATPGLPFTEDFADTALQNPALTKADVDAARNLAGSLVVDTEDGAIPPLAVRPTVITPDDSANTSVSYYLSNDNGARWHLVQPGHLFTFPAAGSELRWRAENHLLSPVRTPRILGITLMGELVFINGFETPSP